MLSDDEIFKAFHGRCAYCVVRWASCLHHIVPKSAGGSDAAENKIPLCTECHEHITTHDHRSFIEELLEVRKERLAYFSGS